MSKNVFPSIFFIDAKPTDNAMSQFTLSLATISLAMEVNNGDDLLNGCAVIISFLMHSYQQYHGSFVTPLVLHAVQNV